MLTWLCRFAIETPPGFAAAGLSLASSAASTTPSVSASSGSLSSAGFSAPIPAASAAATSIAESFQIPEAAASAATDGAANDVLTMLGSTQHVVPSISHRSPPPSRRPPSNIAVDSIEPLTTKSPSYVERVLSGSSDTTIKVWLLRERSGSCVATMRGHTGGVTQLTSLGWHRRSFGASKVMFLDVFITLSL